MSERVKRQLRSAPTEFSTRNDDGGDLYISGYFSVFNSNYEIFPGATESIAETAFDEALSDDIRCLIDHETRLVLGRNKANIYIGDKVYQLKGDKRFNALKYVHIYYRYKNITKGNECEQFLGL